MTTFTKLMILTVAALCCLLTACSDNKSNTQLVELNGQVIDFEQLKGKWVVINYWASWCKPCIKEIPALNEYYQKNKDKNLIIYGVNYDHLPKPELQALITKLNIKFPILAQDPAQALNLGDIPGIPVSYIYNPENHLSKKIFGGADPQKDFGFIELTTKTG